MEGRERPAANFTKTTEVTTVMTTVTSGDKRIDKYDDEKRQDGDYLLTKVNKTNVFLLFSHKCDMGQEHASREKKCSMVIFFIFVHKNVYRIRFQKIKIGPLKGFENKAFFSLLLMRKRLSGGQKWFLKPYFLLIRGMSRLPKI